MTAPAASPPRRCPALCVLASGSAGNCSIVHSPGAGVWLIDLGLSPRRTRRALQAAGLDLGDIRAALLTHPDHDHLHPGWSRAWPAGAPIAIHQGHLGRARGRLPRARFDVFEQQLDLGAAGRAAAALGPHDTDGAAVFRLELGPAGSLGYATDIGRCDRPLLRLLGGVDTLAIESNNCPRLQAISGRPALVIDRIVGGAGHLSNQQCHDAVRAIAPRARVVLLHLSRDCNHPALARRLHHGAPYELVLSSQSRSTPWLALEPGRPAAPCRRQPARQLALFTAAS
ncbi:MAG: MBL fold metallo-hydrolase [Phycisphaerales bacterium JB039]